MLAWLEEYEALLWSLTALSVFMFVATLIAMPLLIARLPADYFTRRPVRDWPTRHPAVHLLLVVAKNALGLVLLLAGLAMLVLPGQGLLTIFVAIMLLDFPRKRDLERWLIRRRPIFRAANWIRAKRHRPPLELPEAHREKRR
ncbi:PGPGW domain-containing protein [Phycisphaerales bacterium AB-hyl4]|uniref:PGPGW domain-containing protein n=1 Tax=Natronomicrosphaera hydrolytica TaxID=3242702 RepID=A0ABV4U808_9BACT